MGNCLCFTPMISPSAVRAVTSSIAGSVSGFAIKAAAPGELGGALAQDAALAAEAYRRVFFATAATLTVALISLILIEEKPLQSGDTK